MVSHDPEIILIVILLPPPQVVCNPLTVFISFQVKATKSNGGFSIEILGVVPQKNRIHGHKFSFRNQTMVEFVVCSRFQ